MSNLYAPFRYDYVGSFLRPAELKKARADYEAGAITADQLKAVEDQCITELVAKQKAAGYHVITDGEFRRATWHLDFMWGFDGVGHKKTNTGLPFHGEAAMIDDTFVTGRIGLSVSVCEGAGGRKDYSKTDNPRPCSDAGTILDALCQKTHRGLLQFCQAADGRHCTGLHCCTASAVRCRLQECAV